MTKPSQLIRPIMIVSLIILSSLSARFSTPHVSAAGGDVPPPPTVDIKADDSDGPVIALTGNVTLTWSSAFAVSCEGSGSWNPNGPQNLSGNLSLTGITTTLTFTLTCLNTAGSATDTVTIFPRPSPPTVDIKANGSDGPVTATSGSASLTWVSTNAISCFGTGAWFTPNGPLDLSGSQSVTNITTTLTFTITCTGLSGTATDSVTVKPPPLPPVGQLEGTDRCFSVFGWAFDPNTPTVSIQVHFYADGPAGIGRFLGAVTTDQFRDDINQQHGLTGNHGFLFPLPNSLKDHLPHEFWAYGIDSEGGTNPVLTGSPVIIQCRNNAQFVSQVSPPSQVVIGQSYQVSVSLKNTGDTSWSETGKFRLASQNPENNTIWGMSRVILPAGVVTSPDITQTFNFSATAPLEPGSYHFAWRMVEDGVESFGQTSSDSTVTVTATPPTTPTLANLPACGVSPYTGQGLISWTGTAGSNGFSVDIDDDPNFGSFFTKSVPKTSTDTNDFLGIYPATNVALILQPNVTYSVRVFNGLHSPVATFRVPFCPPTVNLQGRTESGTASDGPLRVDFNHPITLTWTTQNATTCSASGGIGNWTGAKPLQNPSGETTDFITTSKTFILTCINSAGISASDSLTAVVILASGLSSVGVVGDIFSGTGVAGLSIDPSSVIAASGAISALGTSLTIPGYQQTNQTSWETIRAQMLANVNRLKNERAVTLTPNNSQSVAIPAPNSTGRLFNLNPKTGNPFDGDQTTNPNQPEGGVFYVAGDLELTAPLTLTNTGTIIVAGNIRLVGDGAITVNAHGTLGLVALGAEGISFDPVITEIHGIAFFAANGPIVFQK